MKKSIYILVCLVGLMSCEDQLNLRPTSELTFNGFWESEEGVRAAMVGVYVQLRWYEPHPRRVFSRLGEMRSDLWGGPNLNSMYGDDQQLITQTFSASQPVPRLDNWAGLYVIIHLLNDFILNAPTVPFTNEQLKNTLLGEAHGLRAYVYYTLLKAWGEVPITTEPQFEIDPANVSKPRSPESEVMGLIKDDIEKSLSYFGDNLSFRQGQRVYWSKTATLTLKGDVYIWSGTHLGGGASDYSDAKQALEQVQSADVELLNNFSDVFTLANKNNKEIIFATSYELDIAKHIGYSFTVASGVVAPYFDEDGNSMSTYIGGDGSINRYGVTDKVLLLFDDVLDSRREGTFMRLYSNSTGYPTYDPTNYVGSLMIKWPGEIVSGARRWFEDNPHYRYADALLLLAEAKNLLGEDPSAEINQVRQRAYGDNYVPAEHGFVSGSQDENTAAILEERLKEFVGEGKRWWDLRRAGDSWVIANVESLQPGDEYKLVLPISEEMLSRNPALEQTEKY